MIIECYVHLQGLGWGGESAHPPSSVHKYENMHMYAPNT